ncbi:MAG: virulence RhuM family protein [Propionibacteriaceae bacterium]|nr:virulence RhuM family protein [Propionibacteriaceae bacterium]
MTVRKRAPKSNRPAADIVRSSAVEYLTFVAATGEGGVEAVYADENVWLTQKMMATLYGVTVQTVSYHINKIMADNEVARESVIRSFLTTAADGKKYQTQHYSLAAIIAVGYKVDSERAVQFRKWATQIVEEFAIKGFAMDDERLKRGGSILTPDYFEEQLARVREIRMSERRFYQKITDIYATAIDYDPQATATRRFFTTVQNKLHWGIHGRTSAEVIAERADASRSHMGLTTWKDAPDGKIQQFDVVAAKNYLTEDELEQLERLVSGYIDLAESMARRHIPMTMADWEKRLDIFIETTDRMVLHDAGKVTAAIARAHALSEFEKYRLIQDDLFRSDFDRFLEVEAERGQAEGDDDPLQQ